MRACALLAVLPLLGLLAACEGLGLPSTLEESLAQPSELNDGASAVADGEPSMDEPEAMP